MRSTLEAAQFSQQLYQARPTKISLPSLEVEWQEPLQGDELAKLGNYIAANIQSERKSILELYSTSICLLHKNEHSLLPELATPKAKRLLKRRSIKDTLKTLSPSKPSCSQELTNDRDFVVSSHFPNRLIRKEKNRLELLPHEQSPIAKRNQSIHQPKETPEALSSPDRAEKGSSIPKAGQRKKLPRLLKAKASQQEPCQLNPWEYLQIQDEPIFSYL